MKFEKEDYEQSGNCPWCNSSFYKSWGYNSNIRGFISVKCNNCSLIYIKNRFNKSGLQKYYNNYLNDIHQFDQNLNKQRRKMYALEYNLLKNILSRNSKVLDVGCSGGYFLEFFKMDRHDCAGIEFGKAAAEEASKKFPIYYGNFPEIEIVNEFDLIIFRGVIEHVFNPKRYLDKAYSLLNDRGMIYITSTPNSGSFCCRLYQDLWNQHIPEEHIFHFSVKHFDDYFFKKKMIKIVEKYFYEETPYANIEDDILCIAEAISSKRKYGKIEKKSPPFYGNMMSVIYRKWVNNG